MSSDDDDVPDEVGFTNAKSTAMGQREKETKAAKDDMAQRKSKMKRKQAWFQESKDDGQKKKKVTSSGKLDLSKELQLEKDDTGEDGADLNDVGDEQSDIDDHFFQDDGEPSTGAATPNTSGPLRSSEPDFISLKDTVGNPVTVVPLKQKSGSYRDDALKFARDRFNPPNVYRVPAAKVRSITAKRRAARSSTKC